MKEKLKLLKNDLKQWNKETFGDIENRVVALKNKIQKLDILDDIFDLEESKVIERKEVTANLFRSLNQRTRLISQ